MGFGRGDKQAQVGFEGDASQRQNRARLEQIDFLFQIAGAVFHFGGAACYPAARNAALQ